MELENEDKSLKLLGIKNKVLRELLLSLSALKDYIDIKNEKDLDVISFNVKKYLDLNSWNKAEQIAKTLKLILGE